MKTTIAVILDESSSMGSKISEVIVGFNAFLKQQKDITDDTAVFHLVKFNSAVTVVHRGLPIKDVPELSQSTYHPSGYTALYDAIADGVRLAQSDTSDRYVCVIITDGEENASRRTTFRQVRAMIQDHEGRDNWTFVYIGENPDRWAQRTGSSRENSAPYDHNNPAQVFYTVSEAITEFRGSRQYSSDVMLSSEDTRSLSR